MIASALTLDDAPMQLKSSVAQQTTLMSSAFGMGLLSCLYIR